MLNRWKFVWARLIPGQVMTCLQPMLMLGLVQTLSLVGLVLMAPNLWQVLHSELSDIRMHLVGHT